MPVGFFRPIMARMPPTKASVMQIATSDPPSTAPARAQIVSSTPAVLPVDPMAIAPKMMARKEKANPSLQRTGAQLSGALHT